MKIKKKSLKSQSDVAHKAWTELEDLNFNDEKIIKAFVER
jgi:hypothetical protein